MATKKKIVSVDAQAGREVLARAGRKGKSAARGLVARASEARGAVENGARTRRDSAIRSALRVCVDLSSRQLEALKKLETGFDRR